MSFLRRLLGHKPDTEKSLDGRTITQLAKQASDMSVPRDANHYLYLPTEDAARAVAALVARDGRNVHARPAATGASWLVLVNEQMVVDEANIEKARREFTTAVTPYGGDYDGWEAAAS